MKKIITLTIIIFLLTSIFPSEVIRSNQLEQPLIAQDPEPEFVDEFIGNSSTFGDIVFNKTFEENSEIFTTYSISKMQDLTAWCPETSEIVISNIENHGIGNGLDIRQERFLIGSNDLPYPEDGDQISISNPYYPIYVPAGEIIILNSIKSLMYDGTFADAISIHDSVLITSSFPAPVETPLASYSGISVISSIDEIATQTPATSVYSEGDWIADSRTDNFKLANEGDTSLAYVLTEVPLKLVELDLTALSITFDFDDAVVKIASGQIGVFYIQIECNSFGIEGLTTSYLDRQNLCFFDSTTPTIRQIPLYYEIHSYGDVESILPSEANLKLDGKLPTSLGDGKYKWTQGESLGILGSRYRGILTTNYRIISFDYEPESYITWNNSTIFRIDYQGINFTSIFANITKEISAEALAETTNPFIRFASKNSTVGSIKQNSIDITNYIAGENLQIPIGEGYCEFLLQTPNIITQMNFSSSQSTFRQLISLLTESTFYSWVNWNPSYDGNINIITVKNHTVWQNSTIEYSGVKLSGVFENLDAGEYLLSTRSIKPIFDFQWFYGSIGFNVLNKTTLTVENTEYSFNFTKGEILTLPLYFTYQRLNVSVTPINIEYGFTASNITKTTTIKEITINTASLRTENYTMQITISSAFHEPKSYIISVELIEIKIESNWIFLIIYSASLVGMGVFGFNQLKKRV